MFVVPRYCRNFLDLFDEGIGELDRFWTDSVDRIKPRDLSLAFPIIKDDKFNLDLNLNEFEPADISVKLKENALVVNGKREIKDDDGSYEYREFSRVCSVPDNVLAEQLKCKLDQNTGMLRIEAPLKEIQPKELGGPRTIPIQFNQGTRK